ncbi:hypothetical protein EJ04DRAFT_602187 [Polyplosphaeria fusca]|uniref:ARB-07466-like C-terminal domain-containing protein n=1 Tax=Polyplosphaeria fusca TaxID=682080 RepID=A0A9P4QW78_9PLEO|nr:hypothetical protein EJ04DRAFT_602187 [Polyplosphaeria fusca]
MQFPILLVALLASRITNAATNEPCYGANGIAGVCIAESSCTSSGGVTINGGCPSDASNIKCCSKASCGASPNNCRWSSDCGGASLSGQCPGPAGFKCCQSSAQGFGGYAAPSYPALGACKQVSITGAKKIVAAFPGRIREIFCTRDCACSSTPSSDHCCGKATDMMCSDAGGTPTISGRQIAEWVMNNRGALNLKYVIWGQRIWNPSQDSVGPWTGWRGMEDRGDVTQNHWDHVHVSYN